MREAIQTIVQDLWYGLRMLRKQPLSNGIIVLTIALLISGLSVLYTAERDARTAWAPFPDRDRIVTMWRSSEHRTIVLYSSDVYHGFRDGITSFESLGALRGRGSMTLTSMGDPTSYRATSVTRDIFEITQPQPVLGRLFAEEEYAEASDNLILISEQLWREKLGADTNIIGRDLVLDDKARQVIGVMPAGLRSTTLAPDPDIWFPLRVDRSQESGHLHLFGKLKPGATLKQAQAEFDVLAARLEAERTVSEWEKFWGAEGFRTTRVVPLTKNVHFSQGIPSQILYAWIFAGLVLVCVVGITCFNITNLLLARFSARSRELAIRVSLGAGRLRIVRQLLTETASLAVLGGVLGLLASFWFSNLLRLHHIDPKMDWRLYLIAFSVALLLTVLVGLVPALRATRRDLLDSLREGGLGVGGRRRHRLRNSLVTSEVAMASALCVVGGSMARNALDYYRGDLGFNPGRVVCVGVEPRRDRGWSESQQTAYLERGLQALREMPGIERASVCVGHYFTRFMPKETVSLPGPTGEDGPALSVSLSRVDPEYSEIFGMPVVGGQRLSKTTQGNGEVLVNETFAAWYFPDTNAVGRQIRVGKDGRRFRIAGVTRDRHHRMSFTAVEPEIFLDFHESHGNLKLLFIAQTRGDAAAMARPIREALSRLDASQPVQQPEVISDVLAHRAADVKGPMMTLGLLAGVGLLIALAGVYGVVAFSVVERTREVGIRMALGATRGGILRLVLWQGTRLMLVGLPLGLVIGGFALSFHAAQNMMDNVPAWNLPTLAGVVLVVGITGGCASLIPARRATRIHPMEALRSE